MPKSEAKLDKDNSFQIVEPSATQSVPEFNQRIILRPTKKAIIGILTLALVCIVVLDFLVYISFTVRRVWANPRLFADHWYSLPVYLWIVIVLILGAAVLRLISQFIVLDESGIKIRGALRIPLFARWEEVAGIWMAREVYRGKRPLEPIEIFSDGHEAFIVMRKGLKRIANISGRFYGLQSQYKVLSYAFPKEIEVHEVDRVRYKQLNQLLPGGLSFFDRHSNLFALLLFLFFLVHNVLTFIIWGL